MNQSKDTSGAEIKQMYINKSHHKVVADDEATHRAIEAIERRLFWTAVKAFVVGYAIVGVTGSLARLTALWIMR